MVLADTRGPFTFEIYANQQESAECISGPSFTRVSGSMSSAPVKVPARQVLPTTAHRTTRDGQAYSFADGHTGSAVTAVKLILDGAATVESTVDNGWFVAWWPSTHGVEAADVTTPAGVTTQKFDSTRTSPSGAKPCTGGGIDLNSSGAVSGKASGSTSGFALGALRSDAPHAAPVASEEAGARRLLGRPPPPLPPGDRLISNHEWDQLLGFRSRRYPVIGPYSEA